MGFKIILKSNYVHTPFKFLFETLNINEALLTLFYGLGLLYETRCDTNINIENVVKYLCNIFSTNNYKMRTINRGVIPITI